MITNVNFIIIILILTVIGFVLIILALYIKIGTWFNLDKRTISTELVDADDNSLESIRSIVNFVYQSAYIGPKILDGK